MRPIYKFIKKENGKTVLFKWMSARQKTFEVIKSKLVMILMITYLNFNKLFILYTDALGEGIKTILY